MQNRKEVEKGGDDVQKKSLIATFYPILESDAYVDEPGKKDEQGSERTPPQFTLLEISDGERDICRNIDDEGGDGEDS